LEIPTKAEKSPAAGCTRAKLNVYSGLAMGAVLPSTSVTDMSRELMEGGNEEAPERTTAAQSKYGSRKSLAAAT
jgi:hypothetical protein